MTRKPTRKPRKPLTPEQKAALVARFGGKRGVKPTGKASLILKPGRPRENGDINDPTTVARLLAKIASGYAIATACASDPTLPTDDAVWQRMAIDPDFAASIADARASQQDRVLETLIQLADSATPDDVNVKKLQIWTRQWVAMKLAPKKYGDKTTIAGTGPEGNIVIEVVRRKRSDDDEGAGS